jgi:protein subunit release factor B
MSISKEKQVELAARMERLAIRDGDLIEKFILGSGSGGQKINKTSSCVYLKHIPSGIEIKCQRDRSRELNRYIARKELCERIEETLFKEKSSKRMAIEKIRRQKRRRSKRAQEKVLEQKHRQGSKKELRRPPSSD